MVLNEKFCPVCKYKNGRDAIVCIHCGASLDYHRSDSMSTTRNADISGVVPEGITDTPIDNALIPEDGIAIYVAGTSKPVYLIFKDELIFGRKAEEPFGGDLLDLTSLGGYQMGISRRHAVLRKLEKSYELTDLGSTNGSWLNNERLTPFKPYPLVSGSQLRFGRMRLLILYHSVSKNKKQDDTAG